MPASGKKRAVDADGRVCDLGVWDGLRPARAVRRPVSSRGYSFSAKPMRLVAGGMGFYGSGSLSAADLNLGLESVWPELRVPAGEERLAAGSSMVGGGSVLVEVMAGSAAVVADAVSVGFTSAVAASNVAGACLAGSASAADVRRRSERMSGSGDDGVSSNGDDMVCLDGKAIENVAAVLEVKAGSAMIVADDVSVGRVNAAADLCAAGGSRVGSANAADTLCVASACRVGSSNAADVLTRLVPMSGSGDDGVNSNGDDMVCLDGNANVILAATPMSYADMLRNQQRSDSWVDDVEEDAFTDADAFFVPGRCGLNLKFSKRVLDALDRNWRYAVIVKLMGKPSSKNMFDFVLRGLRRKWHSKGCWKLIDLPKDYFVVNFELEEDMVKALCDGPWVLGGHTLIVRRWCATFNPLTDVVRSMAVWARVEGLPLRYFTEFAMTKIGKLIGEEVVRVDDVTTQRERGRYGRVCVEIDLNKPFKSLIEVEDILYKVRYEGLDHLCFKCGMYGHADESCMVEKAQMAVDSEGCEGPSGHACEGGEGNTVEEVKATDKEVVDDGFGPWMIMDYKNKKRNGKVLETEPMSPQGSRFSILDVEGDAWPHKATSEANEKMEVDLDVGREEPHPVIPRVPLHDLPSAPSSKAKKNSKLPKDSIKLTKEPVVSRTRGPPSTPHPSCKLVAIQGSRGRSQSEDVCVSTEAPPFEDGVKRIVARFEGADATTCRDSSFPFCSSSHAG